MNAVVVVAQVVCLLALRARSIRTEFNDWKAVGRPRHKRANQTEEVPRAGGKLAA
jgi:hypothetical protein